MRFLQLPVQIQSLIRFQEFYEQKILSELDNMQDCISAGLLKSHKNSELISLTVWDKLEALENYEKNGVFAGLFSASKPYLYDSSEWSLNLNENMELEYKPDDEDPVIKKYFVKFQKDSDENLFLLNKDNIIRIVSGKIQKEKIEEFKKIYLEEIIPQLKIVPGCNNAYLIESLEQANEFVSLTAWENEEAVNLYENTGKDREFIDKIQHTFSQLYLWKRELEKDFNAKILTTEDLKIEKYKIITGKKFK